jgi:hypothetical protein
MMRFLLIGMWVCFVTLASTYGGVFLKARQASSSSAATHAVKLEVKKVKPITVPMILGGQLKGYVSAEFSFLTEVGDKHDTALDPESFIMEEAFRLIYSDNKLDFSHLEKVDIDLLTKQITANVNARLGVARVKETHVKSLAFVPKEDLPR